MARYKTVTTELMCLNCGTMLPISRKSHKQKEKNHLKDIWCYKCKAVTKHVEKLIGSIELRNYISANSKPSFADDDIDWKEIFNVK